MKWTKKALVEVVTAIAPAKWRGVANDGMPYASISTRGWPHIFVMVMGRSLVLNFDRPQTVGEPKVNGYEIKVTDPEPMSRERVAALIAAFRAMVIAGEGEAAWPRGEG